MSDNNNNRRNGAGTNRVSGPTSALTSFLREHGISVRNRSRRERREEEEEQRAAAEAAAAEAAASQEVNQETEPMEGVEVTNSTAQSSSLTSVVYRRFTRGAAKKRKSDDSDDDGNDDANDFAPSSSRRTAPSRARILFCTECKGRFARKLDDAQDQTVCPNCLNGTTALKKKKVVKKRQIVSIQKEAVSKNVFPSLQDICISVVAEYIDDVDSLGVISEESSEKLSKIICKNRKLNDVTSRLFMDPINKSLMFSDCTLMTDASLLNICQFCPRLEFLELVYCGRINDRVLDAYTERLHNLKSLKLSGAFLISPAAYNRFFEQVSKGLQVFELRHSALFSQENIESLAKHCVNLRELKIGHLHKMDSEWLASIARLKNLTTLEISWCSELQTKDAIQMLSKIGHQLTDLSIRGGHELEDNFLIKGVLKNCNKLEKLNLEQCDQLTATAMVTLFTHWKTKGLTHLNISRCLLFDDKVIRAIVRHSGSTLKYLNIHSLDLLTASGVELLGETDGCGQLHTLDCGFVRSVDDFVLKKVIDHSPLLNTIFVWGCPLLTDNLKAKGLNIIGKELTVVV
ncbi:hypothetical protein MFLAVUS_001583 [Mucor flavus]|uniref:RNI-like protein n=1 Tax=Mucor flavus TaxID=439312 RepID=A0ABP9YMV6_9FUNG